MQRQALPLQKQESSLLETVTEIQLIKASQFSKIASESSVIKYASHQKIIIEKFQKKWLYKTNLSILKKYKGKIQKMLKNKKIKCKIKPYILENTRKSNQNIYVKQTSVFTEKDWIKKGQIITNGLGIYKGKLSLGKTILIAYMGWEGYNFEDAVVINKNLVDNNTFTSLHTKKYKVFLIKNKKEEV